MPQGYCTRCQATVTIRNGACLLGHAVAEGSLDPQSEIPTGRHRAPKRTRRPTTFAKKISRPSQVGRVKQVPTPRVGATITKPVRQWPPSRSFPFLDLLGFSDPGPDGFDVMPDTPAPPATATAPLDQPVDRTLDRILERVTAALAALPDASARAVDRVVDNAAAKVATFATLTRAPDPVVRTKPDRPTPDLESHVSIFDLLPRLSDFRSEEPTDNTGTLVQRLWEATDTYQPTTSWTSDPSDLLGRTRPNRVVIGLVIAAMVAVLAITVANVGGGQQPAIAKSFAETLADAQQSLSEARQVALLIADPVTSGEDLSNAAVTLTALDSAGLDLAAGGEELLTDPTLQDSGHALIRASALARGTGRRLGDALTYRLVFSRTFALPELPVDAETTDVADLGFTISAMISETRSSLARLPSDQTLDAHHEEADAALATIENITPDYLQALRDGDPLTARIYANQISREAGEIQAALAGPLQEVADAVGIQLDGYAAELNQAEALHPAP